MTGKLNNRQAPRCSMPGSPSKAIIAAGELGADGFCPTPLTGGRLMFVSRRPSDCGAGTADIYATRLDPVLGWLPPKILPCTAAVDVNSFADEFSPSLVEAEGRTILFFSSGRDGFSGPFFVAFLVGVGCRRMAFGPRLGTLLGTLPPTPMCAF